VRVQRIEQGSPVSTARLHVEVPYLAGNPRSAAVTGFHGIRRGAGLLHAIGGRIRAYGNQPCGSLREGGCSDGRHGGLLHPPRRGAKGTYVSVGPFHVLGYLHDQACRPKCRRDSDVRRLLRVASQTGGNRLQYKHLIAEERIG